jgi:hypothetical protein
LREEGGTYVTSHEREADLAEEDLSEGSMNRILHMLGGSDELTGLMKRLLLKERGPETAPSHFLPTMQSIDEEYIKFVDREKSRSRC